jgi:hypothetical protein
LAAEYDVAARLAEGHQAVETTQSYVWASHLLGYQNPDLTLNPAQICDWYSSEDGMDLHVLDADHSVLQAAAAGADNALGRQRDQLACLAAAWQGDGAASATEFLRRHCDSAENVAATARTAADGLAALRDALWRIVDTKVAAVSAIDNRRQGERTAWLGAAQTVITGVGDRAAASELVDRQVKSFVDNDIRVDWLTAVRTAIVSIGSSYEAATAGLTSVEPVQFDVPGDFGPEYQPRPVQDEPAAGDPATSTRAAPSSPATTPLYSSPAPSNASPVMPFPMSMPADVGSPATVPPAPATSSTPASGLEGLGKRFADALSGLMPSRAEAALPDSDALKPSPLDDTPADDVSEHKTPDKSADKVASNDSNDTETDCSGSEHKKVGDPAPAAVKAAPPESRPAVDVPPAPTATAPPPRPEAPPREPPAVETATPCQIAADQLPQAGQ